MLLEFRWRAVSPLVDAVAELALPVLHFRDERIGFCGFGRNTAPWQRHARPGKTGRRQEPATADAIGKPFVGHDTHPSSSIRTGEYIAALGQANPGDKPLACAIAACAGAFTCPLLPKHLRRAQL